MLQVLHTYYLPHTPHLNLGDVVLDSLVCCIYQPCAKAQRGDSSIMLSVFRKLSIWTELSEGYGEQCRTDPLMNRANNAARAPQGRLVVLCDKRGSVIFLKKTRKHYIECCSQHKGLTSTHGEAKHAILMDRGCAQLQRNLFFRVTIHCRNCADKTTRPTYMLHGVCHLLSPDLPDRT